METLILVDEKDNEIGYEEKIKAHKNGGKLHRAFSIFIFNDKNELLLQKRSIKKYHFGGLWTNTCCSHHKKGETLEESIHRELKEEVGFDTELKEIFTFIYHATDKNSGLTEHELDHVFIGRYNGEVKPNAEEIDEWKWINTEELREDIKVNGENYTPWFKKIIDKVITFL